MTTAPSARAARLRRRDGLVRHADFSFMPKTATLFGLRGVLDYETQASRRYADYFVMMRSGQPLRHLNHFYHPGNSRIPPSFRKRLLDLMAGRFIIAASDVDNVLSAISPRPRTVGASADQELVVYENVQALPRAFYVPTVAVISDPRNILRGLAFGTQDPGRVAFLEELPPSGFRGDASARMAPAEIVVDEPQRVVIRVAAPARGFLHLADQYFPGWRATVNGAPAPIMRANYLFRLVEVPAGESTVEFSYQPRSVRTGAAISAATLLVLVIAIAVWGRRARAAD